MSWEGKRKKRGRYKWNHGEGQKARKKCLRALSLQLLQLLTESPITMVTSLIIRSHHALCTYCVLSTVFGALHASSSFILATSS